MRARTLFLALLISLGAALVSQAGSPPTNTSDFTGVVDIGDPVIGFLRVKNTKGETIELELNSETRVLRLGKNKMALDDLTPAPRVTVRYDIILSAAQEIDVHAERQAATPVISPSSPN